MYPSYRNRSTDLLLTDFYVMEALIAIELKDFILKQQLPTKQNNNVVLF